MRLLLVEDERHLSDAIAHLLKAKSISSTVATMAKPDLNMDSVGFMMSSS